MLRPSAALLLPLLLLPAVARGGPHADQVARFGHLVSPSHESSLRRLPALPPPATHRVYGYLAWWDDDLTAVPWDALTDLALFSADAQIDGTLGETTHWEETSTALSLAAPYGVAVHLCVTQFDTATLRALLGSPSARATLVAAIADEVDRRGAHGVNIDFERMPSDRREEMVDFVTALSAEVEQVVLAIPAVDWSDAWDLDALDDHADLFLMGYAYHYAGSPTAGPNDPLYDGPGVGSISLSRLVEDYLDDGVDPSRLILGLPLYGYRWPVSGPPDALGAPTAGTGEALFWRATEDLARTVSPRWESTSHSPWIVENNRQTWYADVRGITDRIDWALTRGLAGIGFWALNYDAGDDALWSVVRDRTRAEEDDGPGPDPADDTDHGAGAILRIGVPLLAYPRDLAVLAAEVEGRDIDGWRWTQVAGPPIELDDRTVARPRFLVPRPGHYAFEVQPLVDGTPLATGTAWVIAVSRRGIPPAGCSQAGGTGSGLGAGLLLWLIAAGRRRRH